VDNDRLPEVEICLFHDTLLTTCVDPKSNYLLVRSKVLKTGISSFILRN
jgi:hypothetical protein